MPAEVIVTLPAAAVVVPVPFVPLLVINRANVLPVTVGTAAALAGCAMSPSDITIATSTAAALNPRLFRFKTVLQNCLRSITILL